MVTCTLTWGSFFTLVQKNRELAGGKQQLQGLSASLSEIEISRAK